ncbi:hypothetical protein BUALT_Bualt02G0222100 [Buddleja alternifolia]|uniref:Phenazine biosynthesis protein n=1 Tax=Buddleja alternifolia TaxID=168488 RepID=A0AAV6Y3H7_9LAMI|nr:hypothetical protein BUALT_Bualt02G0222100 [Buddleja alternifolia]
MARKPIKYCLVDTFTETPFKGNPSAVCLLEEDDKDENWLQNVAREFNQAVTSYLTQLKPHHFPSDQLSNGAAVARFRLRWFTRDGEEVIYTHTHTHIYVYKFFKVIVGDYLQISICGHATLAASHFLLAHIVPNCDTIELSTMSGRLISRRIPNDAVSGTFSTEMNFPVLPLVEYGASEISTVSKILNGCLQSGEGVKEVEPQIDAIRKYPARGIIITGPAPSGSDFDFYSRFFCPNLGADEDHVCGSSHCALALYWCQRLGKHDFVSYYASKRSGVINLHLDEKNQRVLIRGNAVTVMEGSVLV